jgi:hypothetical protein
VAVSGEARAISKDGRPGMGGTPSVVAGVGGSGIDGGALEGLRTSRRAPALQKKEVRR